MQCFITRYQFTLTDIYEDATLELFSFNPDISYDDHAVYWFYKEFSEYEQFLARLFLLCGIATQYDETCGGIGVASPPHTQAALLATMGIPIENDEGALQATLHELGVRPWHQPLPGVRLVRENESRLHIPLRIPADRSNYTFTWTLTAEQGDTHSESFRPCELEVVSQREIDETAHVQRGSGMQTRLSPSHIRACLRHSASIDATDRRIAGLLSTPRHSNRQAGLGSDPAALLRRLRTQAQADQGEDLALQARRLMESMSDGRIKLYLTWRALNLRKAYPRLFSEGDYLPLSAQGQRAEHVCAFSRRHERKQVVVVAPRWFARLTAGRTALPLGDEIWDDTLIALPEDASREYHNVSTGERLTTNRLGDHSEIRLAELLRNFSVALLVD